MMTRKREKELREQMMRGWKPQLDEMKELFTLIDDLRADHLTKTQNRDHLIADLQKENGEFKKYGEQVQKFMDENKELMQDLSDRGDHSMRADLHIKIQPEMFKMLLTGKEVIFEQSDHSQLHFQLEHMDWNEIEDAVKEAKKNQ